MYMMTLDLTYRRKSTEKPLETGNSTDSYY